MAVADIFSALTGKRSYKDSMPKEKVVSIMQQMAQNHQISQEVVDILIHNYETIENQVEQDCSTVIHNYELIKERYIEMSKMFAD